METLGQIALMLGALSLLRTVAALPLLIRWLRRGHVQRFGAGETPPITIVVPGPPDAFLRQNYPDYEILAERGAESETDVEIRRSGEPRHEIVVAANPRLRPDPLFLRDVADGLREHGVVDFLPVVCDARSLAERLRALGANTDSILNALLFGAGAARGAARGRGGRGRACALARRAVRVTADGLGWGDLRTLPALILSTAPGLLLVCVIAGTRPGALSLLIAIAALRAGIALGIELRSVRDGTTLRAIPLLPLLWLVEPLGLLIGRSRADAPGATLGER